MKALSYRFRSSFVVGCSLGRDFTEEEVKNEPMFFSAQAEYAHSLGGPITRAFVGALTSEVLGISEELVVDTKVAMLMPGWYPCIPGWHHDDVPRSSPDGQPNYDDPEYRPLHAMALVNGEICPTEFAVGDVDFAGVRSGEVIYRSWHKETEAALRHGELVKKRVPSDRLVYFDDRALHQGVAATGSGWRWFGRASWRTKRPVRNEIRRQVQVYLASPFDGW